ncbi:NADP-dependent oxidoreductase [Lacticaseibacillus brantae]|nr:NADP-dependent oxidoreductase [Lacticaseibacillus brantae]
MEAFGFTHGGGPEVFEQFSLPTPEPISNQIQIEVKAVGLNNRERMERKLASSGRQIVTGRDVTGVVSKLGDGVTNYTVGQRVIAHTEHGDAQYVVADLDAVTPLPDSISFEVGAAMITPGITAYKALNFFTQMQPSQTIIIKGASGGVGEIAVQLAVASGATVIGIGASQNEARVKALGVSEYVAYDQQKIAQVLANRGDLVVNVAMNGAGDDDDLAMVKPGGVIVTVSHGAVSSSKATFVHIRPTDGMSDGAALEALIDLMAAGNLSLPVGQTFPLSLDGIIAAYSALEEPHDGRLVLTAQ